MLALLLLLASISSATPPNIPSPANALTDLSALTVLFSAASAPPAGYSRDKFPHWITISGACDARETVLKRDGAGVTVSTSCAATGGSWTSPYDGKVWTKGTDVDIDHVVPLANAWKSGASAWTTSQRQALANDLTNPQLIAVTDELNQAKGDSGPEAWKPPLASYHCTYASMWVRVKRVYNLTATSAEKAALQSMLGTCQNVAAAATSSSAANPGLGQSGKRSMAFDGGVVGWLLWDRGLVYALVFFGLCGVLL